MITVVEWGCDKPKQRFTVRQWVEAVIAMGLIVLVIVGLISLSGCTSSDAKPPQHMLEIGDPVLARSSFNSVEACEQFVNRLIVVLHKAKNPIPENMRCQ